MSALLIELGTEDLPARYVVSLANALAEGVSGGLNKRGVATAERKVFATPRRIAVLLHHIALQQPDQKLERQGPALAAALKDGKPTPAALGFAKSCGVEFSELGEKDGKLFFARTVPGKATAGLLPEIFEETLKQMDELVPKRMRWGEGTETFVRPVQWIVALLDEQIVPLQRFGLASGRVTYGHRFHAPEPISLRTATEYEAALKSARVWVDFASRQAEVRRQIEVEAARLKGTARVTEGLLEEVTALVEWPVAISGRMEERFMALPPEVIVATVETNQRYFTVFDAEKRLLPAFIAISNIESKDVSQVIVGNERVVRPRLSDAMFFWQQDLSQPLEAYGARLETITFQKDLGSVAHKVGRVVLLSQHILTELQHSTNLLSSHSKSSLAGEIPRHGSSASLAGESASAQRPWFLAGESASAEKAGKEVGNVLRAAGLSKNDLVTRMVYEFPELQGTMGGYYAAKSGEPESVASAIREHYLPTQQGTPIPSTLAGRVVALADKLDTLAGIFAIGQKPTASKDPFGLRRAALGALRICIEGGLDLDLSRLLNLALQAQPAGKRDDATLAELTQFVFERLRGYYTDRQLPAEMFEAVRSLAIGAPLDFDARVQALRSFWALPASKNLAAAHKRVRNILKQAGEVGTVRIDAKLFEHAAEHSLSTLLNELQKRNSQADYAVRLANLAQLREPVDTFFEDVMVNADDPAVRANRLALLRQLDAACREVADISWLPQ